MPPKVRGRSNNNNRKTATSASGGVTIKSTISNSSGIATLKHYRAKADAEEKRLRTYEVDDAVANEFATTMKKLVEMVQFMQLGHLGVLKTF